MAAGRQRLANQCRQLGVGSINEMVSIIEQIAGVSVKRNYKLDAPVGVRGRSSDNSMCNEIYGWEPSISR